MDLTNFFYAYPGALPLHECDAIIEQGLKKLKNNEQLGISNDARTFGKTEKSSMPKNSLPKNDLSISDIEEKNESVDDYYIRDSKIAWLDDPLLYKKISPYINDANQKAGWNWQWDYMESFQFGKYEPGNFYSWHTDSLSDHHGRFKRYMHGITNSPLLENGEPPAGYTLNSNIVGKIRKLSIVIILSPPEEYEGGEFKFDFGRHQPRSVVNNLSHLKEMGTIIIFPSFLYHCVTPVKSGVRYSLVSWCSGDPWK